MGLPQESDPSGEVVQESLRIVSRVQAVAEPEVARLAQPLLDAREALKLAMRSRQDAQDRVFIAEGAVDASAQRVDAELTAFGKRLAGRLVTAKLPGEKHETYRRILAGKTPGTLLSLGREERTVAVEALLPRLDAPENPLEVREDGKDLARALHGECAAVDTAERAQLAYDATLVHEERCRHATVVAARKLAGELTTAYADEPFRVRKLLGQGMASRVRRKATLPTPPTPVTDNAGVAD